MQPSRRGRTRSESPKFPVTVRLDLEIVTY